MVEFLTHLFDTSDFPARWTCGRWTSGHGWLHIVSDIGIWSSYFAIPMVLGYFIARRKDLPFRSIFLLFTAFIVLCGITHLMEAIIFWWPAYRLAGVFKLLTAVVSWATVFALVRVAPAALAMRSPAELEKEIVARKHAEQQLQELNTVLELRVAERTEELSRSITELAERSEQLQTTLASIGDAVFTTDVDGNVTNMNAVAESLTGWALPDALGRSLKTVFNIVNETTREVVENPAFRALREGVIVGLANHTLLIAKDGTERPIDDSAAPIRNTSGEVFGCVLVFRDISERHRQEEKLKASEEQFRGLAESIPLLCWMANPDGHIFWYNSRWYEYTGTTFEQMQGWGWEKVHDPSELPRVVSKWKKSLELGEPWEDVFPLRSHDGQLRSHLSRAFPVRDKAGNVVRWFGTNTDISEIKRAQDELRRSKEQEQQSHQLLTAAIAASHTGTFLWNPATDEFLVFDDNLKRLFGIQWDEPIRTTADFLKRVHPDDLRSLAAAVEACRNGADFEMEYRVIWPDGEIRWLYDRAKLQRNETGEITNLLGACTDITERKRAEETLQFQLDLTKSITDNATTAIFMMNEKSRCTFMNPAAEQMTGFKLEEVQGSILHDFIHHHRPDGTPYPVSECPIDRALPENGEVREHEDFFYRKNGESFPVTCNARVIYKEGLAIGTVIEVRDTTKERQAADALRLLASNLSEADRKKDEFLATLAHELRNPLAPIRNGLQVMKLMGDDAVVVEQTRSMIERQLEQMVRLVDDLMDVSRITRGKVDLRMEEVPLADIVSSAMETSRPLIDQMSHELTVTLPDQLVIVNGDPTRLAQVLMNLLNNAAKYSDRGGHIRLKAERLESSIVISVKDSGIGIDAAHLPHIFEMFTQVDRSLEKAQGGLGIGLTLVKRLVEMHGGQVEAMSPGLGQGSEFVVTLPAVTNVPAPNPSHDSPTIVTKQSLRILIVDDNKDGANTLAMMLKILGNETWTAYDGQEGLELAEQYLPSVALFDIGLPKLNGFEACRRIREQPWGKTIVMIAVTGWGQEEDRRRSSEAGFDHHLVKPVDPLELMKMLTSFNIKQ